MRPFLRPSLAPVLLASAMTCGCTAIADPGSYELDTGCDLELELIDFGMVHPDNNLTIQIDSEPNSAGNRETKGIAMLVGIPPGVLSFHIPLAIHDRTSSIDFFVDNAPTFGTYNPQAVSGTGRGDHSWILDPACGPHTFRHVAQFEDFEEYTALDENLVFDMQGFDLAGNRLELLVSQYDQELDDVDGPEGDGRFTLAFQHTTNATDVAGHFVTTPLRGMLERGVPFRVEVFVDRDGDQVVDDVTTPGDPSDEGYVFEYGGSGISFPPGPGPLPLNVGEAGTDDHSGTVGLTITP